jgi:hypothetical protein
LGLAPLFFLPTQAMIFLKMKSSLFVFCLIFLLCCQCASLTDRKQYVRVASPKAQTKIYYDSELVGQGPSTLRITRKPRPQIIFKTKARTPLSPSKQSTAGDIVLLETLFCFPWHPSVGWLTSPLGPLGKVRIFSHPT